MQHSPYKRYLQTHPHSLEASLRAAAGLTQPTQPGQLDANRLASPKVNIVQVNNRKQSSQQQISGYLATPPDSLANV